MLLSKKRSGTSTSATTSTTSTSTSTSSSSSNPTSPSTSTTSTKNNVLAGSTSAVITSLSPRLPNHISPRRAGLHHSSSSSWWWSSSSSSSCSSSSSSSSTMASTSIRYTVWTICLLLPAWMMVSLKRDGRMILTLSTSSTSSPWSSSTSSSSSDYNRNGGRSSTRHTNRFNNLPPNTNNNNKDDGGDLYSQLILSVVTASASSSNNAGKNHDNVVPEPIAQQPEDVSLYPFTPYLQQLYQYQPPRPATTNTADGGVVASTTTSNDDNNNIAVEDAVESECGLAPNHDKFFKQDKSKRSRLNEDKILYELLFRHPLPNATTPATSNFKYIEMGGFNGVVESNSRFYDVCLQWDGLLVEPNPQPFANLVQNRPNAHVASFAASCSTRDALSNHTVAFYDYNYPTAGQKDHTMETKFTGRDTIQVPCGSLTPLIRDVFDSHIHFFSLDVETAEPLVLQQLDLHHLFVEILLIEIQNQYCLPSPNECPTRDQTRQIMEHYKYHRFENLITNSDLYIHPSSHHYLSLIYQHLATHPQSQQEQLQQEAPSQSSSDGSSSTQSQSQQRRRTSQTLRRATAGSSNKKSSSSSLSTRTKSTKTVATLLQS